jgi:hypothetical protein
MHYLVYIRYLWGSPIPHVWEVPVLMVVGYCLSKSKNGFDKIVREVAPRFSKASAHPLYTLSTTSLYFAVFSIPVPQPYTVYIIHKLTH